MRAKEFITGVIRRACMTAMTLMQKCTAIGKRGLPALLALLALSIPAKAVNDTESTDSTESEPEVRYVEVIPEETEPETYVVDGEYIMAASNATTQYDFIQSAYDIFSGIIRNADRQALREGNFSGIHYVAYRDDYNYYLAYGPGLTLDGTGGTFSAESVELVSWRSDYNNRNYTTGTDSNFSLSSGSRVVCSDLGTYPCLDDGRSAYEDIKTGFILVLSVLCLVELFYSFFGRRTR